MYVIFIFIFLSFLFFDHVDVMTKVAPPLKNMENTMKTPRMAEAGDNYDTQEFLKPVTVTDTIQSPQQLGYVQSWIW